MESIAEKLEDITKKFPGASEKGLIILYTGTAFVGCYCIVERDGDNERILEVFMNDNSEELKGEIRKFIQDYKKR